MVEEVSADEAEKEQGLDVCELKKKGGGITCDLGSQRTERDRKRPRGPK